MIGLRRNGWVSGPAVWLGCSKGESVGQRLVNRRGQGAEGGALGR